MKELLPKTEEIVKKMVKHPKYYAAIYARQSNAIEKFSLEDQIAKGKKYAEENNLAVYKIYSEKVSASSKSVDERKMFQELLRDARAGYFKTVIAARRDRVARNIEEFFDIKKEFKKLGIKLAYSNDGEFQSDDGYISSFIENVVMAVAELEPEQIKMRIRDGNKRRKEEKIYTSNWENKLGIKKGKTVNKKIGKVLLNYKEYEKTEDDIIVKLIFQEFVALDENKIKNVKQAFEELRDRVPYIPKEFDNTKLKELISNPVYAGLDTKNLDLKYDKDHIAVVDSEGNVLEVSPEHFHTCINIIEPIVESNDWFDAVKKLKRLGQNKEKSKSRKTKYIFQDILYCSKCKGAISLKGEKYRCNKKCINMSREKLIISVLSQLLPGLLKVETLKASIRGFTSKLRKEVNALKVKLSNNIIDQEKYVNKYLLDSQNEEYNKEFICLLERYEEMSKEIKDKEEYIAYLNNEFLYSVMMLLDTKLELAIRYITANEESLHSLLKEVYNQGVYINNGTEGVHIDWDGNIKPGDCSSVHKSLKQETKD